MLGSGEIYQALWKAYVESYGAHAERLRAEWDGQEIDPAVDQLTLRMVQVCAAQADAILQSVAGVIATSLSEKE